VIYERLALNHPTNEALRDVTLQHMEDYGSAGLRTLCLSFKEMDTGFYDQWQERYIEAKTSMDDRQAKVDAVSEEVERDLVLLGCTAIEDKLQEGVPAAIKALADANIGLWVLTGDKMVRGGQLWGACEQSSGACRSLGHCTPARSSTDWTHPQTDMSPCQLQETAINIGYACSLIIDEMTQFQVTGHSPEVEALEAWGHCEEALLLAGRHVKSELERVSHQLDGFALGVA